MKNIDLLLPENYYHIYNHAVGNENLFRTRDNYHYFLSKFNQYIYPICESYSYCLLPNHFHFLIKTRAFELVQQHFDYLKSENKIKSSLVELSSETLSAFYMQQFSNLFNAYTKAYNKSFSRKGALFVDYMKRKQITSYSYFTRLITYIHQNPLHHNLCKDIGDWEFSSYQACLTNKQTKINRTQVLNWFGGANSFIELHRKKEILIELEF